MTHILLSHHYPEEYSRCLKLKIKGKIYHICTRCTAYFIAFIPFLILNFFYSKNLYNYDIYFLLAFPLLAIIDWGLSKLKIWDGNNWLRFLTGLLLGLSGARYTYLFLFTFSIFYFLPYLVICFIYIGIILIASKVRIN